MQANNDRLNNEIQGGLQNTNVTNNQAHPEITKSEITKSEITDSKIKDSVVIVGAGLAGWAVVDAIRAKDTAINITLITTDSGDRYHKPMLTMAISQNKTAKELVRATGAEAANATNIHLLTHTQVMAIDSQYKTLTVQSVKNSPNHDNVSLNTVSQTITYQHLVLAMGAQPIFPKSLPKALAWHVNHLDSFSQLQQKLATGKQDIAIVGAGMVGTEIAEDLLKAGHNITLLDTSDAPISQLLPKAATTRIKNAIISQGINFLGGVMVTALTKTKEDKRQLTYHHLNPANSNQGNSEQGKDSQTLIADHVIVSTGLAVEVALPQSAGIKSDARTGILVDEASLQTSVADIYAIGDCMSINGVPCRYVAPLRAQASTIADAILGNANEGYNHKLPMIRLKNKAISVMATGTPTALGNWQVVTDTDNELMLEQYNDAGEVTATATLKS